MLHPSGDRQQREIETHRTWIEKKEEIWLRYLSKNHTPTENCKKQSDNRKTPPKMYSFLSLYGKREYHIFNIPIYHISSDFFSTHNVR